MNFRQPRLARLTPVKHAGRCDKFSSLSGNVSVNYAASGSRPLDNHWVYEESIGGLIGRAIGYSIASFSRYDEIIMENTRKNIKFTRYYEYIYVGAFVAGLLAIGVVAALIYWFKLSESIRLLPVFPCVLLVAFVGLVCWRLAVAPNLTQGAVFSYGVQIVIAASELHVIVELTINTTIDGLLSLPGSGSDMILAKVVFVIFSGVVQFGIAALGGNVCAFALLQRRKARD